MTEIPDLSSLRLELEEVATAPDFYRGNLRAAGIISEAFARVGLHPVLVGGYAVEFYSAGQYTTGDIDLVLPGGPAVTTVMEGLGFVRHGRHWRHAELPFFVEFPSSQLRSGERFIEVRVGSYGVRLISVEDLIVDRLCSFKFWGATEDGYNAVLLLAGAERLDWEHLRTRAEAEGVSDALEEVDALRREHLANPSARDDLTDRLETVMRRLKTRG